MLNIRKSFSMKLSVAVALLAVPLFVALMEVLYQKSRRLIRDEAVDRATCMLDAAMQRLDHYLRAVETATEANSWQAEEQMQPEALLSMSRRVVSSNILVDGCSISAEPDLFPQYGRYFSAYTVRKRDTVRTVIENNYEYFGKIWYRKPSEQGRGCWVVYYDEVDTLSLTLDGLIASYSKPLYADNARMVGVISTDLSLYGLSRAITSEKPYVNSYYMMVGRDGSYYIHPDSTKLFSHTIFDNADPRSQSDVIALGHEMTAGKAGSTIVTIGGEPCLVCYQPVSGTDWSLAIVCPDSDILHNYHELSYIVLPLFFVGLLVIVLFSRFVVARAIRPLGKLAKQTQRIAAGNYEVYIPHSRRKDVVGRLQNSFATMLESLNFHMGSIRYMADVAKKRNEELAQATRMAEEADRQKTLFMQNVSHQIRTPLNIILGFSQVLSDTNGEDGRQGEETLTADERERILGTMKHNAGLLYRMVLMLCDSAELDFSEKFSTREFSRVGCNEVARTSVSAIREREHGVGIAFHTTVADDVTFVTNRQYLSRSLNELLYNAVKYSDGQHVSMTVSTTATAVRFVVQDTGDGIDTSHREQMFKFFTKGDDLSEGLGLGLPLCKCHARNLGGDLTLDADYRDGCRFVFELPLNPTLG